MTKVFKSTLSTYLHNTDVLSRCKSCCNEEKQESQLKYERAVLKVCHCNLGRFPEVQDFIEKKSSQFKNLKIQVILKRELFL